ncbi:MAG: LysM peptidoglycan-binding domain-containing protein [Chloroflexota bacterium]
MTNKSAFTSAEWQLLKDSPYWVQTAITVAEGRMSMVEKRLEGKALENFLNGFETSNQVIKDVLAAIKEGEHSVDPKSSADQVTQSLAQIKNILNSKATREEADEFNDFLLGAGDAIVTASSEGLLSRGEKISDEEAAAMKAIAETLEATPAHQRARAAQAAREKRDEAAAAKRKAEAEAAAAAAKAEADRKEREAEAAQRKAEYDRKVRDAQAERRQREVEEAAAKRKAEAEAKKTAEAEAAKVEEAAVKAAEETRAQLTRHVVQPGETLSHIALKHLGSANRWREIYEANKDVIKNPSLIYPGQEFVIPAK